MTNAQFQPVNSIMLPKLINCMREMISIRQFSHNFFLYAFPMICAVGFLGNVLGFLVINSVQQQRASYKHLIFLAASSSVFLLTVFLQWLEPLTELALYNNSWLGCKLMGYASNVSCYLCAWYIAVISVDRVIICCLPKLRSRLQSARQARNIGFIVLGFFLFLELWRPVVATVAHRQLSRRNVTICSVYPELRKFYNIFNSLNTGLGVFLPLAITLVATIVIVFKLHRFRRKVKNRSREQMESFLGTSTVNDHHTWNPSGHSCSPAPPNETLIAMEPPRNLPIPARAQGALNFLKSAEVKLTRVLVLMLIVFLIMYIPLYSYRLITTFVRKTEICSARVLLEMRFQIAATFLYYFFHGILPYVYIFTNPIMRKELKGIWVSCCGPINIDMLFPTSYFSSDSNDV